MQLLTENISFPSAESLAAQIATHAPSCWLDSASSSHPRSRYSIFVLAPLATLQIHQNGTGSFTQNGKSQVLSDPFFYLDQWLQSFPSEIKSQPFFCGGILGWLSYEFCMSRHGLPARHGDRHLPAGFWMLVDSGIILDPQEQRAWIFSLGLKDDLRTQDLALARQRCARLRQLIASAVSPAFGNGVHCDQLRETPDQERYLKTIADIQERIRRGDVYQINFSRRFSMTGTFDAAELYLRLRNVSFAPQMAFFNLGPTQILSASPETLLEIEHSQIRSYPIKGTRPRSANAEQDQALREELWRSEKDNAELLMIIDLVRNDLGQFCDIGSIRVPAIKKIETLPQVHHLVGCVEGRIPDAMGPLQALLKMSPGGSITGAPKRKAMEIIQELEETPRGIYTGSIGYAGINGQACFNIAIRTAMLHGKELTYSAGSGIVADSNPELEFEECRHKTEGFFQALGRENT